MNISIDAEYIIDKDNKKTKVLLPIEEFGRILDILNKHDNTFSSEGSNIDNERNVNESKIGNRVFGNAKGKFILSPDFDDFF